MIFMKYFPPTCLVTRFSLRVSLRSEENRARGVRVLKTQISALIEVKSGVVGDHLVVHVGDVARPEPGVLRTNRSRVNSPVDCLERLGRDISRLCSDWLSSYITVLLLVDSFIDSDEIVSGLFHANSPMP